MTAWLAIALAFLSLLGLYALVCFAIEHIAQGWREWRDAEPWS